MLNESSVFAAEGACDWLARSITTLKAPCVGVVRVVVSCSFFDAECVCLWLILALNGVLVMRGELVDKMEWRVLVSDSTLDRQGRLTTSGAGWVMGGAVGVDG